MDIDNSIPNSAVVIFAHPDDPEFSCAGTIALWTAGGCKVTYVLLTSGDVGTDDPQMTRERLVEIREAEQTAACTAVGVKDIIFLRQPDCQLVPTLELRRQLTGILRQVRPDVVICGDPTAMFGGGDYVNHPDHRAAAVLALDAVFPSVSQRLLWPELGKAHRVCAVYVSSAQEPNMAVDISSTIDKKFAALRAHKSQMGEWDPEPMIREWAGEAGKAVGVEYAERFRRMTINEPEKSPESAAESTDVPQAAEG